MDFTSSIASGEDFIEVEGNAIYWSHVVDLKTRTIVPDPSIDLVARAWTTVRARRRVLLADSDYLVTVDYPITDDCRKAVSVYRTKLRDITHDYKTPDAVVWPTLPTIVFKSDASSSTSNTTTTASS